jgi:hypothetical protein
MQFLDFDEVSEQVEAAQTNVHYIAIKVDVTHYFDESSQKKYGKIYEVLLFDKTCRTFCCSFTPSFYMLHAGYTVDQQTYESLDEEEVEDMYDFFDECSITSENFYMNVSDVERLMEDQSCWLTLASYGSTEPYQYEDDEEALEDYRSSPYF